MLEVIAVAADLRCPGDIAQRIAIRRPRAKRDAADRFEEKLDRSGGPDACHEWLGCVASSSGYGRFLFEGVVTEAHRAAFMLANGANSIPAGMSILHKRGCKKTCVNHRHLRIGTPKENAADAKAEGRFGHSKLTKQSVQEIARAIRAGISATKLARKYQVSNQTIGDIRRGRTWSHVTGFKAQSKQFHSGVREALELRQLADGALR